MAQADSLALMVVAEMLLPNPLITDIGTAVSRLSSL